jgi:histidinol-phosphate/aromatic aminotransferase/cobyric acid decarboxylase-like protein
MFAMSSGRRALLEQLLALKDEAGSHSPSMLTIVEEVPEVAIDVDACFLSNPYATELFLRRLEADLIATRRIRDVLEFYPSQNTVVAANLAGFLQVPAERLFIGNGAIEVIQAVLHRFAKRKIAVNIPTFSSYYEFAPEGVQVVQHKLNKADDYRLDVAAYLDFIRRERPDTAVLINPNNPDGGYLPFAELRTILAGLREVETVIVDESFIHFAFEDDQFTMRSAIGLLDDHPGLVVVKSMSKDFGIAGIRAGYGVMAPQRVSALLANGYLWNINGLAEYFFKL